MKIRIFSTIVILALWGFLNKGLFYSADVIAKNTLAVSTVNGGDAAFVAQQSYDAAPFSMVGTVLLIIVLIGIWAQPVLDALVNGDDDEDELS